MKTAKRSSSCEIQPEEFRCILTQNTEFYLLIFGFVVIEFSNKALKPLNLKSLFFEKNKDRGLILEI